MRTVVAAGILGVLTLVPAAPAQSAIRFRKPDRRAEIAALESEWTRLRYNCYDVPKQDVAPHMRAECVLKAPALMQELRALNRCYGRKTEFGYLLEWHDCEPESATYNVKPKEP
jgi:hypothetical protein